MSKVAFGKETNEALGVNCCSGLVRKGAGARSPLRVTEDNLPSLALLSLVDELDSVGDDLDEHRQREKTKEGCAFRRTSI